MEYREKLNRVKKSFCQMILTLLIGILAIVAYTGFSFSWFSKGENTNTAGLNIAMLETESAITSLECYHVTDITAAGVYIFDTDLTAESLPVYDINGLNTNLYKNAVVIKLVLSENTAQNQYECMAKLIEPSGFFSAGVNNKLSNAVQFRSGTVSGNAFTPNAVTSFLTHPNTITNDANVEKVTSPIHLGNLSGDTNTVYFVMEYDTVVLQHICNQRSLAADSQIATEYHPDIAIYIQKGEE